MKYRNKKGISYATIYLLNTLCHTIFFRKVHSPMGGKVKWATCGGSPVPAKTLLFFRACGFPIYEGYGLTESPGVVSQNIPGAVKVGTIGRPLPGMEVKIAEDGEILTKGWARSLGYWNNPEATKELFRDGWLRTGDLGFLDEEGFLHINGRKKEVLITATGKNVTPSNIQNLLKSSPYISEAVVFGEGRMYLTSLVTLNEENVIEYAKQRNLVHSDFASLSQHPLVRELIEKEVKTKNQDLANIEQIKRFTILPNQFRQDLDELTPTMKVKRRVVEKRYGKMIEAMYTN
jgi:long-chain acyl-CoA synthetase